jgi:hypothetical protein
MFKLIFLLHLACSDKDAEVILVYVADIIEIESDGCNLLSDEDFWLNEVNIEFTHNEGDLTVEGSTEDDPDSEVFDCESSDGSFNCELFIEDDHFREDEGYSAVMRESFLIEGVWIEELAMEGRVLLAFECIGDDCDEAIADAWEQDGDFDYPEVPCESVLKFEGSASQ